MYIILQSPIRVHIFVMQSGLRLSNLNWSMLVTVLVAPISSKMMLTIQTVGDVNFSILSLLVALLPDEDNAAMPKTMYSYQRMLMGVED